MSHQKATTIKRRPGQLASYPLVWMLQLASYLPLPVLHWFSSFFSFLIGRVIRYRRKVIMENLRNAFPGKGPEERKRIARGFYRNLCDVAAETIRLYRMNDREVLRRSNISAEAQSMVRDYYNEGRSFIGLLGHTGNWEWVPAVTKVHFPYTVVPAYRPLKNKAFDRLLLRIRGRYSDELVPKRVLGRAAVRYKRSANPFILGLIADQTPRPHTAYWTPFLSQDTPVYSGPEKLARSMGLPVFFVALRRQGRGQYTLHIEHITDTPEELPEGELSAKFMALLENEILQAPSDWLWSHRRWKHTRTQPPENGTGPAVSGDGQGR